MYIPLYDMMLKIDSRPNLDIIVYSSVIITYKVKVGENNTSCIIEKYLIRM